MFDMIDYLQAKNWNKKSDNLYAKSFFTIRFIQHKNLIIIMNNDQRVKYNHIATCKTPSNLNEADVIFKLCFLNK